MKWIQKTCSRPLRYSSLFVLIGAIGLQLSPIDFGEVHGQTVANGPPYCGTQGVWIQTLGSGDLNLDNQRATESYLVWIDNVAVLLVNAGQGTALRFDQSGADFSDLDAILLSQTGISETSDIPALLGSSKRAYREEPLVVLGPSGDEDYVSITDLLTRLFSEDGAYPELAGLFKARNYYGYTLRPRDILAKGRSRWAEFATDQYELSAIPVSHGDVPTLAWKVKLEEYSIVFALAFSNRSGLMKEFADEADVIVFTHALPLGTMGSSLEEHVLPGDIGTISKESSARFIILGGRGWRTVRREEQTLTIIQEEYDGRVIFPADLECWGL